MSLRVVWEYPSVSKQDLNPFVLGLVGPAGMCAFNWNFQTRPLFWGGAGRNFGGGRIVGGPRPLLPAMLRTRFRLERNFN